MFVESHIEYRDTKAWVQYFELTDEIGILGLPPSALNKFWEISILGTEVTERTGKIGTPGKTNQTKSFKNEELARKYVENAIWKKVCLKDYEDKSSPLYRTDAALTAIIGDQPLTMGEANDALDRYVKEQGLVDKCRVTSDEKLLRLTGLTAFDWYGSLESISKFLTYIPGAFRQCTENQVAEPKFNLVFEPPKSPVPVLATKAKRHTRENDFSVKRTATIDAQLTRSRLLQQDLIERLKLELSDDLTVRTSDEFGLLRSIELSSESFNAITVEVDPLKIDRTTSMLAGPFYTSEAHPIPLGIKGKMMTPVVQLDLRQVSNFIDKRLGDGLLQVWYDSAEFRGHLRVVPRMQVDLANISDFVLKRKKSFDTFPLPFAWQDYLQGGNVKQITGAVSRGLRSQTSMISLFRKNLHDRLSPGLIQALKDFEKTTTYELNAIGVEASFGGTFYPIQYSIVDVNGFCLFATRGDWGASGGAQIFYELPVDGEPGFVFMNCLR